MTTAWHDDRVDDRAIVSAVLDGNRDAFRPIVEREAVAVYRTCLRILGRPQDAEDVAQEALVMAYRSIASYRGDGALGAWVAGSPPDRRTAAWRSDATRRTSRRSPSLPPGPMPASRSPRRFARSGPRSCGAASPPSPSRIARRSPSRFYGDLALDEIARATGRPLFNTVKTHLRRGLERLRDTVGAEGSVS